jgi:hypothetical protein
MPKDRIIPLLFDKLSEEEIAFWKKKEPWNYVSGDLAERPDEDKKPDTPPGAQEKKP